MIRSQEYESTYASIRLKEAVHDTVRMIEATGRRGCVYLEEYYYVSIAIMDLVSRITRVEQIM